MEAAPSQVTLEKGRGRGRRRPLDRGLPAPIRRQREEPAPGAQKAQRPGRAEPLPLGQQEPRAPHCLDRSGAFARAAPGSRRPVLAPMSLAPNSPGAATWLPSWLPKAENRSRSRENAARFPAKRADRAYLGKRLESNRLQRPGLPPGCRLAGNREAAALFYLFIYCLFSKSKTHHGPGDSLLNLEEMTG